MTDTAATVDGGALPAVPQTHDPDLEAIYRLWIDMIREARMLGGRDAGRRLWRQSPLPPLDAARKGKETPDWVDSFLADSTEPAPGARLKAEALWTAYLAWCQPRGLEPITRKGLLIQLARHGLLRQKASIVYFLNLRLRVQ